MVERNVACFNVDSGDSAYNTRKLTERERTVISLQAIEGKRLTVGGLTNSPPDFYKAPRQIGTPRIGWSD